MCEYYVNVVDKNISHFSLYSRFVNIYDLYVHSLTDFLHPLLAVLVDFFVNSPVYLGILNQKMHGDRFCAYIVTFSEASAIKAARVQVMCR